MSNKDQVEILNSELQDLLEYKYNHEDNANQSFNLESVQSQIENLRNRINDIKHRLEESS